MEEYLKFAKNLALKSGQIMLDNFQLGINTDIKADNTLVTIADTDINSLVIRSIKASYPEHAVIGEEESYENDKAEYVWVCDPIDGTIPFSLVLQLAYFP